MKGCEQAGKICKNNRYAFENEKQCDSCQKHYVHHKIWKKSCENSDHTSKEFIYRKIQIVTCECLKIVTKPYQSLSMKTMPNSKPACCCFEAAFFCFPLATKCRYIMLLTNSFKTAWNLTCPTVCFCKFLYFLTAHCSSL